jgi:hypothetical protein
VSVTHTKAPKDKFANQGITAGQGYKPHKSIAVAKIALCCLPEREGRSTAPNYQEEEREVLVARKSRKKIG